MSIFREFNISMIPGKPPLIIHVSQYESDFVYTFHLVSGKSVLAIPDTAIAVIRGTKRDGNGFSKEASLDTENNKVVVIGEVQMTACAGRNVFELAIINDGKTICTSNFFLEVERAPLDSDTIQSETVLHDLQAIIDSAATATQAAEEASASAEDAAESARTLTIDPTLTQSGQPADALITGKSIKGIEKLNFSPVTELTGELLYMMESGYIRINSGSMVFQANVATMRTPKDFPVNLKAGDVFSLNDPDYRFQFLYSNDGGTTWGTSGWKTADFTVSADTQSYIIIGTADDSPISDVNALLKAVTVTRAYNTAYKKEVKQLGESRNIFLAPNTSPYTLECGYIRVASGTITFEDSRTTLRTPEDAPVTLSPRDIISVASGYRYQFIYLNDVGTAWTGTGWKTVNWQMPASVFRTGYIVVGKADNSVIGDDTGIYKAVTITHTVHKADFEYHDFYDSSHRGYQYIAPESTRAAFSLSKKYGYNTIECDIRLTSDEYMVIHHNDGMPSDSSYKIAEHTLSELRTNANMGSYNGVAQEILTIDDLLVLCKTLDLNMFIELKATLTDAQKTTLVQKVKAAGMSRKAFIICNINDATYIYRANDEYIGLLLNYSIVDSYITGLVNGKGITAIYNQSANITDETIANCHNAGVLAIGWCVTYTHFGYTEETAKAEILRAINAGMDGMTIDQWTCANLVSDGYIVR